jgi:hypothetical protein
VGGDKFFSADAGDIADLCIDLALIFKCDPFLFLDRPASEIEELAVRAEKRMRKMRIAE